MSERLLVKNANTESGLVDILVNDGLIKSVYKATDSKYQENIKILDAENRFVIPGMIDPHVHFRSPGLTEKEDWASAGPAALSGGVTTVIDMPNTKPPTETMKALELKRFEAEKAGLNCPRHLFWSGATEDSINELPVLLAEKDIAGVKLFFSSTSSNNSSSKPDFIRKVFSLAATANKPVAVHSELASIIAESANIDVSQCSFLEGHNLRRPPAAAEKGTELALQLAAETGCKLYICHLSTALEFDIIRKFKAEYGTDSVIAELMPHHLLLDETHHVIDGPQSWAKVNPPLRYQKDREAAIEALLDGTIDLIGSDHAPHKLSEKEQIGKSFYDCPSGFPGVETELGLIASFLSQKSSNWLSDLQKLTSGRASNIFNLSERSGIREGSLADLVILGGSKRIDSNSFKSKAKFSPFNGMTMPVSVYKTIFGGRIIE
ncbi:MAG: dihydroorotase family protein [Spirochaetales bacterium]|nr:dihydroorotase family protein [Spirochaetales bacterium]